MDLNKTALPRLPVPPLRSTLDRYLFHLRPLIGAGPEGEAKLQEARIAVEAFAAGEESQRLHETVVRWAQERPNWLSHIWEAAYLEVRAPVPVFQSPTVVLGSWRGACDREAVAAHLAHVAVDMHIEVQTNYVSTDSDRGGRPLCMADYANVFAANRIPGVGIDKWESHVAGRPFGGTLPRHIIVFCGGLCFKLAVMSRGGNKPLPMAEIYRSLCEIRKEAETADEKSVLPFERAFGALTALPRDAWATVRGSVLQQAAGGECRAATAVAAALKEIDTALFVITLDDGRGDDLTEQAQLSALHGHGLEAHLTTGCDDDAVDTAPQRERATAPAYLNALRQSPESVTVGRWWDKAVQLHVSANNIPALTFEHTGFDSLPVYRLTELIHKRHVALRADGSLATRPTDQPKSLENQFAGSAHTATCADQPAVYSRIHVFGQGTCADHIPTEVRGAIGRGCQALADSLGALDLATATIPKVGREDSRRRGQISSDALLQLSAQVAFQMTRSGEVPVTYESASTKKFLLGRTETVRTTHPISQAFALDYLSLVDRRQKDPDNSGYDSIPSFVASRSLRRAAASHQIVSRLAVDGLGCDRHLLAMRCAARQLGMPEPKIFAAAAFRRFMDVTLSTTRPASLDRLTTGLFGPVSPTCIGMVYFINPESSVVTVTSWRSDPTGAAQEGYGPACSVEFLKALKATMTDGLRLLEQHPPPAPEALARHHVRKARL